MKQHGLALALAAAALVTHAANVRAQGCWDCVFTPPNHIECQSGTRGLRCEIVCAERRCVCRVSGACRELATVPSTDAPMPGAAVWSAPADQLSEPVGASQIHVSEGVVTWLEEVAPGEPRMPVALEREAYDRLAALSGVLAQTLRLASERDGFLRDDVTPRAVYLEWDEEGAVRDVVTYSSETRIAGPDRAVIELVMADHPTIAHVRAEVWERGNHGHLTVTDKKGTVTRQAW